MRSTSTLVALATFIVFGNSKFEPIHAQSGRPEFALTVEVDGRPRLCLSENQFVEVSFDVRVRLENRANSAIFVQSRRWMMTGVFVADSPKRLDAGEYAYSLQMTPILSEHDAGDAVIKRLPRNSRVTWSDELVLPLQPPQSALLGFLEPGEYVARVTFVPHLVPAAQHGTGEAPDNLWRAGVASTPFRLRVPSVPNRLARCAETAG